MIFYTERKVILIQPCLLLESHALAVNVLIVVPLIYPQCKISNLIW